MKTRKRPVLEGQFAVYAPFGTDPGLFGEMKALASCDVGGVDVIWQVGVADVRHGVELAPLHMRTARGGFRWRLPCMHAIIGSRSSRFAFWCRHLADFAWSLLRRRRLRPRL